MRWTQPMVAGLAATLVVGCASTPDPYDPSAPRGDCTYEVVPPTTADPHYYVKPDRATIPAASWTQIDLTVTGWRSSSSMEGKSTPVEAIVHVRVAPGEERALLKVSFEIGSVTAAPKPGGCHLFDPRT